MRGPGGIIRQNNGDGDPGKLPRDVGTVPSLHVARSFRAIASRPGAPAVGGPALPVGLRRRGTGNDHPLLSVIHHYYD